MTAAEALVLLLCVGLALRSATRLRQTAKAEPAESPRARNEPPVSSGHEAAHLTASDAASVRLVAELLGQVHGLMRSGLRLRAALRIGHAGAVALRIRDHEACSRACLLVNGHYTLCCQVEDAVVHPFDRERMVQMLREGGHIDEARARELMGDA